MSVPTRRVGARWLPEPKVSAAPLVSQVAARQLTLSAFDGADQRAFYRARRAGVLTLEAADRLAARMLGEHPSMLWGPDWWSAEPSAERGVA